MIENLARGVDAFTSNAFLVGGDRPVLVDVGDGFDLVSAVEARAVDPAAVLLTHTHPDHVGNLGAVRERLDAPVYALDGDRPDVDHAIDDGDLLAIGDHDYVVLHTPGHKNDHCCFYASDPGILFAGDLIFAGGGFGRTDLPEGNRPTLIESLERVGDTVGKGLTELHPGHGPSVETDAYRHVQQAIQAAKTGT